MRVAVADLGRSDTVDPGGRAAWYRLSHEPEEPSEVCLDARRSVSENPDLEELLAIIDRVEELVHSGRELGGCWAAMALSLLEGLCPRCVKGRMRLGLKKIGDYFDSRDAAVPR